MCDFITLATPGVQGLMPYQPGKPVEELERELGIENIVKLASNENPLGPSPQALASVQQQFQDLTRYPDASGFVLKQALSHLHSIAADQITLGNGSNNVLDLIARAYLQPGAEAIYSQYAFVVYQMATQAVGATAVVVPAHQWGHDLAAMADAITDKTRVIFLANPNNPTGTWFNKTDFSEFMQQVPEDVIVVLDEAYFEYVAEPDYPSGLNYLATYSNLIVIRTFSKAYGLAALRVGYSISNPQIADILNRVRSPFNVNSFALAAATAVLADSDYLAKSVQLNDAGMQQVTAAIEQLGLDYIPSAGNFVSINFARDALPIYQALLHEAVIVRPLASYKMPNFLRVSIGTEAENHRFIDALTASAVAPLWAASGE